MRDSSPDLEVGDSVPQPIVTETTTVYARFAAPLDDIDLPPPPPLAFSRLGSSPFDYDDDEPPPLPPIFASAGASPWDEEDEPPPLPPIPEHSSQPHALPSVTMLSRVIVPRSRRALRPVPRRAESHTPPVELDPEYEALLRALG